MKFSANLGFLWADRSLIDAVYAAKQAGFDAVECHWPYNTAPEQLHTALAETGLNMLGLNTIRGDVEAGENGLAALPLKKQQAKEAIDQAIEYAAKIKCQNIHVMAGFAEGADAYDCFFENLDYACAKASPHHQTILIEPLNHYDAPGYFLNSLPLARKLISALPHANIKLMFDCYHVQILHGDVTRQLSSMFDEIGHIQFASVPDRGAPDAGELSYSHLFRHISALGYDKPLGAEYKPAGGDTDASLTWLSHFKSLD